MAGKRNGHDTVEKKIEKYLTDKVNNLGGLSWKFTSPGTAGVPDRIVILNGLISFVELKRPEGGKISDLQYWRIKQLIKNGQKVYVLKNTKEVDEFLGCILRGEYPVLHYD